MSLGVERETVVNWTHPKRPVRPVLRWTVKGTQAILDQGFFSGAHFLLNILLARWLETAEYGAFALAYSVFLLLAAFHTAGFVEPMLVFGPGRYKGAFKRYFRLLLNGHAAVSLLIGLALACVAALTAFWSSSLVAHSLYALAFTGPALLLLWMVRRAFYVDLRPGWAAAGGGLYLVLLLCLVYGLRSRGWLSAWSALVAMGVAALIVGLALALRLKRHSRQSLGVLKAVDVLGDHWNYGRWSMAAAGVAWIPANIFFVVLPAWGGLKSVAALRALANLVIPASNVLLALATLLLPFLVRRRDSGGKQLMTQAVRVALGLFLLGAAAYFAGLWFFRAEVFHVLYGGRYERYGSLPLLLLALFPFTICLTSVLGVGLMALERPEKNFWSFGIGAVVAITIGVPMSAAMGVTGAALGMVLANLSAAAGMYVFYRRSGWQKHEASPELGSLTGPTVEGRTGAAAILGE
ncbi:MAG TPA: polysaccharide biosynthesis C-terminal domain-containing protein [Patescibacteria group bacterium]|nr:polysaccharide biosynthesis C-terminal domain-containing protein [Patescibacteria group bacterium]